MDLYDDTPAPDAAALLQRCEEAEDAALAHHAIHNSEGAQASHSQRQVMLATSNGFSSEYRSSHHALSVCVLGKGDESMERDYAFTQTRHEPQLRDPQTVGKEAAERTARRINPRTVPSCRAAVVFDPRISRSLLNSFTGAISGAAIARGTSFLQDKLQQQVWSEHITIVDDPLRCGGLASRPFDDEAVTGVRRELVSDGMLNTWLLDSRSAAQLNMRTTGHGSRSLASHTSPAPSNVYIQPGELPPEALFADLQQGLYVTDVFGMGVNLITGDYSQGASGLWIDGGTLAYPVSEITIAGKLTDMFRHSTPANDLRFDYGSNAPTLRIDAMTIAGQ